MQRPPYSLILPLPLQSLACSTLNPPLVAAVSVICDAPLTAPLIIPLLAVPGGLFKLPDGAVYSTPTVEDVESFGLKHAEEECFDLVGGEGQGRGGRGGGGKYADGSAFMEDVHLLPIS